MKLRGLSWLAFTCLFALLFTTGCTADDSSDGPGGTVDVGDGGAGSDGSVSTRDSGSGKDGGAATDAGSGMSNEGGAGGGSFTIGGLLTGLAAGDQVVLQDNGGDSLTLSANGAFTFATAVASGAAYSVAVLSQPTAPAQSCVVTGGAGKVAGGSVGTVQVVCTTAAFTLGGTVSGLAGTGLALTDGSDDLAVTGNGKFTFGHPIASGTSFTVTVKTQPTGPVQTCRVAAGTGTIASGNVTSVNVNCNANTFTIGGTVTGLAGTGLVLQNNLGDNLSVTSKSFAFPTPVASGQKYSVTVLTQPSGPSQTCTVAGGSGSVATADITSVVVTCATATYTVGGTISGLGAGDSVVLQDNGGDALTVTAPATTFTFATPVASGATYAVTAMTPTGPVGQTCSVTSGASKVGAMNVTTVTVTCAGTPYTVGGTITGLLAGQSVVLLDNGGDSLTVTAPATSFTFATGVPGGSAYVVSVKTQPSTGSCHLFERMGTIGNGPVTTVTATCGIDYYVNAGPTGSDANSGLSSTAPWKTITHATKAIPSPAGGILNVAIGNYTAGNFETFPITPGANQTLLGDPAFQGKGAGNTLVSGVGYYAPASGEFSQFFLSPVIVIPAGSSGVSIRGLDIVSPQPLTAQGVADGVLVDNASAVLANNSFSGSNDYVVITCNGASVTLLDSTVDDGVASIIVVDATSSVKARRNILAGEIAGSSVQVGYMTVAPNGSLVDLGTASDPGGNTIVPTSGTGLVVPLMSTNVQAVGNIWRASVQGASASGTYSAALVPGPIAGAGNENYQIATGGSVQF